MLTLFTDTDTDITLEDAATYGYKLISMPYSINDKIVYPYEDFKEFDYTKFYNTLREGVIPKTFAISPLKYIEYFEPEFEKGNDILYVHFSSAMSGTFNAMQIALDELSGKYPDRKCYTIDTKGITILSNLIVKEIANMYNSGATLENIMKWAEENVDKYATYFFADSLNFFRKSGRVSNFAGIVGNVIGIKPIIYMDDLGTMTNISKSRGRITALNKLVDYVADLSVDIDKHRVIIGHTDSLDLAKKLGSMIEAKFNKTLNIEYVVVNPTAGSHCGPDTVGVVFFAKHR